MTPHRRPEPIAPVSESAKDGSDSNDHAKELDQADQQRLQELQARDREVRAHEQAHLSAAGGFAQGAASYTYERGPDHRMYAVGGEVQVDTAAVPDDPVATLRKAEVIRRAALAPVSPSAQDRQVAAEATQMAAEARAEIAAQKNTDDTAETEAGTGHAGIVAKSESAATCPACGGAHSGGAHDGMSAYQQSPTNTLIASV